MTDNSSDEDLYTPRVAGRVIGKCICVWKQRINVYLYEIYMCLVSLSSDSEEEEKTPNVRAVKKRKIGSKLKYASKVQQVGKGVQETIDISSNDEGSKKDAFGDDSDVEIIDDGDILKQLAQDPILKKTEELLRYDNINLIDEI